MSNSPNNLEARYQLSTVRLVANDYEAVMQQLLEIARYDRNFRRVAAHTGLLAIFKWLRGEDERVLRYRALLQAAMH